MCFVFVHRRSYVLWPPEIVVVTQTRGHREGSPPRASHRGWCLLFYRENFGPHPICPISSTRVDLFFLVCPKKTKPPEIWYKCCLINQPSTSCYKKSGGRQHSNTIRTRYIFSRCFVQCGVEPPVGFSLSLSLSVSLVCGTWLCGGHN